MITLCLIVKNEDICLQGAVESCKNDFDELVIVDTGSTDNTIEIAHKLGAKVYYFEWCDSFSAARNFAQSKCETEWIFMIDADERLLSEYSGKVRESIQKVSSNVSVIHPRLLMDNISHYCDKIYRKDKCHWINPSHNVLVVDEGEHLYSNDIMLVHDHSLRGEDRQKERHEQRCKMNESNFREKLAQNPNDTRSLFYLALTVQQNNRPEEAIQLWNDYLEMGYWAEERYEARLNIARCLMQLEKYNDAVTQLMFAYQDEVRRAEAAIMIGDMYLNGNCFNRAEFWYKIATLCENPIEKGCMLFVQSNCHGIYPWLKLAKLYHKQNKNIEKNKALEKALEIAVDDEIEIVNKYQNELEDIIINSKKYWNKKYKEGVSLTQPHRDLLHHVANIINEYHPSLTLDVATGTGYLLDLLDNTAIGMDFSSEIKKDNIIIDDATVMSTQADNIYDAVTCCSLLEHLEHPELVLQQIKRVSKLGALIVISVPKNGVMDCNEHIREYSKELLEEQIKNSGLVLDEINEYQYWWIATIYNQE